MAFRRSDLQEAFFVPGTQPFRARLAPRADHQDRPGAARAYGTSDPLEEVLAPGYFKHAGGLLRPGELIYVSMCPGAPQGSGADHGAARMALVMVRADERDAERALGSVRAWLLGPTTKVGPEQRGSRTSAGRAIRRACPAPWHRRGRTVDPRRSNAAAAARPAAGPRSRRDFETAGHSIRSQPMGREHAPRSTRHPVGPPGQARG